MKNRSGFTLIELLIVVAIIGILAAIAVPNFLNAQLKAKVARVRADLQAIDTALNSYMLDNNAFPPMKFPTSGYTYPWNTVPNTLTTPISYISSARIIDPFRSDDQFFTRIQGETAEAYGYNNIRNLTLTSAGFDARDLRAYGEWRLFSAGPDSKLQPFEPYDSSNGLVSCGDVLRTQRSSAGLKLGTTARPLCQ